MNNRLPATIAIALGLVLASTAALATRSWIAFALVFALFLVATAVVMFASARTASGGPARDPESRRLERRAEQAAGGPNRSIEAELDALEREPSRR